MSLRLCQSPLATEPTRITARGRTVFLKYSDARLATERASMAERGVVLALQSNIRPYEKRGVRNPAQVYAMLPCPAMLTISRLSLDRKTSKAPSPRVHSAPAITTGPAAS